MLILSDKAYQFGKKLVQIVLPAFSALYCGLAALWELPEPDKVVGTIAVVTTFLGVCLGSSSSTHQKANLALGGKIIVTETSEGRKLYSLEIDGAPEDI